MKTITEIMNEKIEIKKSDLSELLIRIKFLQNMVNDLNLSPDCRSHSVNADFDYINDRTKILLNKYENQ